MYQSLDYRTSASLVRLTNEILPRIGCSGWMLIIIVKKYKNSNGENLWNRILVLTLPNNRPYKIKKNTKNNIILKPIL